MPNTRMSTRTLLVATFIAALAASAQAQYLAIPRPSPGLMPNPAAGKGLYEKFCASCHGKDLRGNERGDKKGPPLLHGIYQPSHHGDAAFQMAAKHGVKAHHWPYGDMQPVAGVTPDEVAHITAFVRREQKKAGVF